MAKIELNPNEVEMLRGVLESYLSDLRMEISDTDSMEFRNKLKEREEFIKKLLNQI